MKLYLVGQYKEDKSTEIQGIFDSKDKAITACRNENFWWMRLTLNEELPIDTIETPDEDFDFPIKS